MSFIQPNRTKPLCYAMQRMKFLVTVVSYDEER
jgi:hypothetical protein